MPSTSTSLSVPVNTFTATDNVGVTGFLITESSTPPLTGEAGWTSSAPATYTAANDGSHKLYPWAKDAAGNVSAVFATPRTVVIDTTVPTVSGFTMPATSASLAVPVTTFTAIDNVGVTGYLITESSTPPLPGAAGWTSTVPATYTAAAAGSQTVYPWAKDAVGNVSAVYGSPQTVLIDTTAPNVSGFIIPSTSTSLSVPVTTFTATDNVGVTGYLITESSTKPLSGAAGWTNSAPATYTAAISGSHKLYPWAKDAAGNVSAVYATPQNRCYRHHSADSFRIYHPIHVQLAYGINNNVHSDRQRRGYRLPDNGKQHNAIIRSGRVDEFRACHLHCGHFRQP